MVGNILTKIIKGRGRNMDAGWKLNVSILQIYTHHRFIMTNARGHESNGNLAIDR